MQDALFAAIEILSIGYVAVALASFISRIDTRKSAPVESPAPEPTPAPVRAVAKPMSEPVTLVVKPEPINLAALNLTELRAIAKTRGIGIRAVGVDRRLNKGELIAALNE